MRGQRNQDVAFGLLAFVLAGVLLVAACKAAPGPSGSGSAAQAAGPADAAVAGREPRRTEVPAQVEQDTTSAGSAQPTAGSNADAEKTEITGRLDSALIQGVVRRSFDRIRICYDKELAKNPTLEGRIAVRFIIDRSGAVIAAHDAGSELPSQEVISCVIDVFKTLSFPEPEGGNVTVVYPLVFKP